ncbi:Predicted metal-dependent phosphoesterase TrpH, contains PHP domain [Halopenitus malekzadehii]|uniref:Predicted metal-dependent phosphoesterase TrpH, contains PHP domain n=1 Tax=Halopenitus malekzadehii TaxID=1267564 RepID=A0A1H6IK09_9EURY|nr:PHP domain-containing protein [Halopenitus malekzadehii]SEH49243.1 Predicted metal-dependent phosphoesterase TrpH, contains PHP domain [Halopenitus malekzadehii]
MSTQNLTLRIDPHVHSEDSYDGHEPVDLILEHAADIGLDAVVITDHDVMGESLRAAEMAPEYGLVGIPGVEVSTAHGHLLAIGVDSMPPHRESYAETVAWIHDHGGVAIVPHPFQRSRHGVRRKYIPIGGADASGDTEETVPAAVAGADGVDAIEAFNAWLFTGYRNRKARRFAAENDLAAVAASDAHTLEYVGRAFTEVTIPDADSVAAVTATDVLDALRAGSTSVAGRRAPVPMAARHYAIAAARKSGYYAKTGAIRSAAAARWGAMTAASTARVGAVQGAHRIARVASWLR